MPARARPGGAVVDPRLGGGTAAGRAAGGPALRQIKAASAAGR